MIAEAQLFYYDAQDTVTDREENFTIPGITGGSVNPLAKIKEPLFTIFKPGYEAYKARRLSSAGDDGRSVFQLGSLSAKTRNEKINNMAGIVDGVCTPDRDRQFCIPEDKFIEFVRLIDIERKTLGLRPRYPRKGNAQQ